MNLMDKTVILVIVIALIMAYLGPAELAMGLALGGVSVYAAVTVWVKFINKPSKMSKE